MMILEDEFFLPWIDTTVDGQKYMFGRYKGRKNAGLHRDSHA